MLTEQELMREAALMGVQKDPLEKAIRLVELLESVRSHPFLKSRIAHRQPGCRVQGHALHRLAA